MAEALTDSEAARQRVVEARSRFRQTLDVARRELAPATVSRRATRKFRNRAEDLARQRPALTIGLAAVLFALFFRKPIAGLIRRLSRETSNG